MISDSNGKHLAACKRDGTQPTLTGNAPPRTKVRPIPARARFCAIRSRMDAFVRDRAPPSRRDDRGKPDPRHSDPHVARPPPTHRADQTRSHGTSWRPADSHPRGADHRSALPRASGWIEGQRASGTLRGPVSKGEIVRQRPAASPARLTPGAHTRVAPLRPRESSAPCSAAGRSRRPHPPSVRNWRVPSRMADKARDGRAGRRTSRARPSATDDPERWIGE